MFSKVEKAIEDEKRKRKVLVLRSTKEKEKTDKICETYKTAMQRGELSGG
jgi:hypothetical protein